MCATHQYVNHKSIGEPESFVLKDGRSRRLLLSYMSITILRVNGLRIFRRYDIICQTLMSKIKKAFVFIVDASNFIAMGVRVLSGCVAIPVKRQVREVLNVLKNEYLNIYLINGAPTVVKMIPLC